MLFRSGFLYYKITDVTMCQIAIEYQEKVRNSEIIMVDIVRFNHIFSVVKKYCANAKRGLINDNNL